VVCGGEGRGGGEKGRGGAVSGGNATLRGSRFANAHTQREVRLECGASKGDGWIEKLWYCWSDQRGARTRPGKGSPHERRKGCWGLTYLLVYCKELE
jgi:hypothetical protein